MQKSVLLTTVGALVLIGGSVGTTLYLTGALNKEASDGDAHAASPAGGPPVTHAAVPGSNPTGAPVDPHAPGAKLPPIYQNIEPPFVVNFEDQGVLRYMQIGLATQTRYQLVADAITLNMPQIRNSLIMLFTEQKLDRLATSEGKENLRTQSLAKVQEVMQKEIGFPGVDAVYFTVFVLQ